jgi:hypothetical protein
MPILSVGSARMGHNFAPKSQGRRLFDRYPIIASSSTPFSSIRPAVIVQATPAANGPLANLPIAAEAMSGATMSVEAPSPASYLPPCGVSKPAKATSLSALSLNDRWVDQPPRAVAVCALVSRAK